MKKLFALAGAVAIIAVALVGRSIIFDDDAGGGGGLGGDGDSVDQLLCPEEFEGICDGLDADVEYEVAGETADRLIETRNADELHGSAWIVPRAWADMVVATRAFDNLDPFFDISEPLASTNVVLAVWDDVAEKLECPENIWACLADNADVPIADTTNQVRVGMPDIESATGLSVAAVQATEVLEAPDFGIDAARRAAALGEHQMAAPFAMMQTAGPGRLTAATIAAADARRLTDNNGSLTRNFGTIVAVDSNIDPRVDLVVVTAEGASLDGDLRSAITEAFTDAGWEGRGNGPDGMPDGDLLAVIREEWSR